MLRSRGPGSGPLLPQTLRGTLGNWFLRAQEDHIPTVAESSPAALLTQEIGTAPAALGLERGPCSRARVSSAERSASANLHILIRNRGITQTSPHRTRGNVKGLHPAAVSTEPTEPASNPNHSFIMSLLKVSALGVSLTERGPSGLPVCPPPDPPIATGPEPLLPGGPAHLSPPSWFFPRSPEA